MLPDFIIIGAMKAGTTSLHYYLSQHPQLAMSNPKELNFFIQERNWEKGQVWYESHFTRTGVLQGESSPNYTGYPNFKRVPENMHSIVPDAKLIYVLRDPIERIISHYIHLVSEGRETRPFKRAMLEDAPMQYVLRSRYHLQLQLFLPLYPRGQILLTTSEKLAAKREETLGEIFRFLGVDESFSSVRFSVIQHRSSSRRLRSTLGQRLYNMPYRFRLNRVSPEVAHILGYVLSFPFAKSIPRPQIDSDVRAVLVERLADDLRGLRAFTGQPFNEWSC